MLIPKLPREPNLSPVRFLYGIWQNLLGNFTGKLPSLPTNDPNIAPTPLLHAIWQATQSGGGGGLPTQTGHAGEFLTTDGSSPSWVPLAGGGDMLGSNNLSDLTNIATARVNLGGTATGISLFTAASAAAARAAIGAGTGTGDLLAANNLSDLANAATARGNLGSTVVGDAVFIAANGAAARAAIGAGTSSFDGAFGSLSGLPTTLAGYGITDAQPLSDSLTLLSDLPLINDNFAVPSWTTAGPGGWVTTTPSTVGRSMFMLANPSAVSFPRFNADNTVTALSDAGLLAALGLAATSSGGNGAADAGLIPLFSATGGLIAGGSATAGGTNGVLAKTGSGFGVQSTVFGNAGYAFEASVSGSPTSWVAYSTHFNGSGIGFSFDGTGAAANSIGIGIYTLGAVLQSGLEDGTDTFGILRTGSIEWYAAGTNFLSGTDKTVLTPATPSGTHTITVPAITGTLVTTGDTGSVTSTMLAGSIAPSKIAGTAAILGANTFTGVQTLPNGTAGAPALNFGDSTTGLYRSAANQIGFAVSGNARMKLYESGGICILELISGLSVPIVTGPSGISVGSNATNAYMCSGLWTFTASTGGLASSNRAYPVALGGDVVFLGEAAQHFTHRNGTTAQILSVSNTWTSTTNFERFKIDWAATANTCRIGTSKGASGSARAMNIEIGDTAVIKLGTAGEIGLYGVAAVAQATTAGASSTFAANTSLIADDTATFDGYTIGQVVKALRNIGALA